MGKWVHQITLITLYIIFLINQNITHRTSNVQLEFQSGPTLGSWTKFQCVCVCGGFSTPIRIQLNSNTIYPEIASDSTVEGSVPQDCLPFQMLITSGGCYFCFWATCYKLEVPKTFPNSGYQSQVQVVTCTSDQLAINQRFPQPSPWIKLIF